MDRIYDYIVMLFYGLLVSFLTSLDTHSIIGLLLAIIFASLFYLYEQWWIVVGLTLIFLLLLIAGFYLLPFTPLILYAITAKFYKVVPSLICLGILCLLAGYTIHDGQSIVALLFGYVLACYLSTKTNSYNHLDELYRKTRDDGVEKNLLLTEKYNALRNSQDAEIYAATLQERNRIAREIHDNVGHLLSRALLMIGALKAVNPESTMEPPLCELDSTLSGAMDSIRSSVHRLHDDSIDLENMVYTLLDTLSPIISDLDYDMGTHVPKEIKYCIIAILKEAINNIMKHSNADAVTVFLREHPKLYQFIIQDNGSSSPLFLQHHSPLASSGIGLENMSERICALHGNIQFSYDQGFRIFITIPKG